MGYNTRSSASQSRKNRRRQLTPDAVAKRQAEWQEHVRKSKLNIHLFIHYYIKVLFFCIVYTIDSYSYMIVIETKQLAKRELRRE